MTRERSPKDPSAFTPRTWGALAVVGLVAAFSLSSTLVKSAESPGVLVAFWRLLIVSVVWNVYLGFTGRRVNLRHVRQAFIPGVFFGVNLATFFVGATNNSVANAALIGSLSPFLIVPLGAKLFGEYNDPRALVFAVLAFGGAAMVLLNAPASGDASLRGNVFGVLAMFLWVGYVVSTRHYRRDMDVATFMATISPIAAVAVLPLAIANGDVFGMSGKGWAYTLVLTFLTGVAAHGLLVFAQRTIQIGTIGIAQVAQPALAVVWSFLLLEETVRSWQLVGIAIVMSGLFAFLVLNERGSRVRRAVGPEEAIVATGEAAGPVVIPADPPHLSEERPASPWFLRRSASPGARRFGRGPR
jgi:drug/metabolite transporter (DMT)-like permease